MSEKRERELRERELRAQIAREILSILEEKGWKQQELANRSKKPKSFITKIIKGESNLTIETIVALERALGKRLVSIGEPKVQTPPN